MAEQDRSSAAARPGALSLNIKEKAILLAAYMPFLKGGGLFIPTTKSYKLGDEIFMLITLMGDPSKYPVAGKVVWISPAGAQGNRAQGVGVQFSPDDAGILVRNKIEGLVAGQTKVARPTHTM
jgi:type IV pilus assembly protein PilZ